MGDRGLLLELGDEISFEVNEKVRRIALGIRAEAIDGIVETIPTYRSLLIIYNPLILPLDELKKKLKRLEEGLQQTPFPNPKLTRIPVLYGGLYGPDLEGVANYHQISSEDVIRLHCSKPYFIYMIGFMPGFPYMGELPEALTDRDLFNGESRRMADPRSNPYQNVRSGKGTTRSAPDGRSSSILSNH